MSRIEQELRELANEPAYSAPVPGAEVQAPMLNRERAMLTFNRRVLTQAQRQDVPLLERLRYITIVSSNIDEFFEVRVAELVEASHQPRAAAARRNLAAVAKAAHELIDAQYALFNDQVMPALGSVGVMIINHAQRTVRQSQWVRRFFNAQVRPLLVPVSLAPSHPFPLVANKSLNFIVRLGGRRGLGGSSPIAIVKVPRALPRVIRLPDSLCPGRQGFVLLTSVIRAHLAELFPGRVVESFSQFRVTRDSDLDVEGDDFTNLRQALRSGLRARHFGRALRLEVVNSCPVELSDFLLQQFDLPEQALYRVNGPVNLVRLNQLIDQAEEPATARKSATAFRFEPHTPSWPAQRLPPGQPILSRLRRADVLLHHPFESFEPVVQFLREAVHDPRVLAIKQTIYRTGEKSVLMDLLIEAARRGKEVLAVVELTARFDEEANINWAERLEAVGAQVVYGIVGMKTHAKLLLVTRREGPPRKPKLVRYLHLSTGNYNPKTALLYTDIGYLTAHPGMAAEADGLFMQLASQTRARAMQHLLSSPFAMHRRMLQHIDEVAEAARQGKPTRIVAKTNALTDPALAQALLQAGRAGVQIDLIVRGACILPPGLPGISDNIRVRSIIGRFLEHSRILYFSWGPSRSEEILYLSSADWMSRNMFRRIEVAWPVRDLALRQRVIDEALVPYLLDQTDAWELDGKGRYKRVAEQGLSAQKALMQRYA